MATIFNFLLVPVFTSLLFAIPLVDAAAAAGENKYCCVTSCKPGGPTIRFPFQLKEQQQQQQQQQQDDCGYPGFELYCSGHGNETVLEFKYHANISLPGFHLSFSVKASIESIDYEHQLVLFSVLDARPELHRYHHQLLNQNSPFKAVIYDQVFTVFNCSATTERDDRMFSWFGRPGLYFIESEYKTFEAPITSCTKMYNFSAAPYNILLSRINYPDLEYLTWSRPNCGNCESKREYCKLKNNSTARIKHETVCFTTPIDHASDKPNKSDKAVVAGKIGGPFFILLLLVALYYVIKTYKQKREDQLKIEMFLADYKALKPARYSYADIRKITNQFKEKLGQGGYGSVYKGQLSSDVLVAVKILNSADSKGNGEEFINEVSTIGLIHHVNVVRLVGYCADGSSRALVYEFLPNNSLEKYVRSGKNHNNRFLGWEKLQKIALGIAKGIEYLHQGCAQRILHFDIKPHNILLDQNFYPKISDFGLAKLCSKGQSIVSMTMARGTIGYIAPEVFSRNFGKVSSKSDVYSFGMLLLEMVGARNNTAVATENSDETYFPEWIFHRLEQGGELTIQIENEVDNNIARKLTIVGLWCIGWHPVDRPSMKHVIQMLEREDCPAIPPNPFSSTSSRNATATTHASPFTLELEVISESFSAESEWEN